MTDAEIAAIESDLVNGGELAGADYQAPTHDNLWHAIDRAMTAIRVLAEENRRLEAGARGVLEVAVCRPSLETYAAALLEAEERTATAIAAWLETPPPGDETPAHVLLGWRELAKGVREGAWRPPEDT